MVGPNCPECRGGSSLVHDENGTCYWSCRNCTWVGLVDRNDPAHPRRLFSVNTVAWCAALFGFLVGLALIINACSRVQIIQ